MNPIFEQSTLRTVAQALWGGQTAKITTKNNRQDIDPRLGSTNHPQRPQEASLTPQWSVSRSAFLGKSATREFKNIPPSHTQSDPNFSSSCWSRFGVGVGSVSIEKSERPFGPRQWLAEGGRLLISSSYLAVVSPADLRALTRRHTQRIASQVRQH